MRNTFKIGHLTSTERHNKGIIFMFTLSYSLKKKYLSYIKANTFISKVANQNEINKVLARAKKLLKGLIVTSR